MRQKSNTSEMPSESFVSAAKSGLIRKLPMSDACHRRARVSSSRTMTLAERACKSGAVSLWTVGYLLRTLF